VPASLLLKVLAVQLKALVVQLETLRLVCWATQIPLIILGSIRQCHY
jgi:hypothetical protein